MSETLGKLKESNDSDNEDCSWMMSRDVELILESHDKQVQEKITTTHSPGKQQSDVAGLVQRDNLEQKPEELNVLLNDNLDTPEGNLHIRLAKLKEQQLKNGERLRNLKRVKAYKEKNNLETLERLIIKWRNSCQEALNELIQFAPQEPKPTMRQLLSHLSINPSLVEFDKKTQEFFKSMPAPEIAVQDTTSKIADTS
uniref:Swi5-dependent recombination DNA repair protein 1 homolog n=1 Tax=Ciona savignyi TaxID=51511 RepID=H2YWC1_CIOSA